MVLVDYVMSACRLAAAVGDLDGFANSKVSSSEWSVLQTLRSSGAVTTSVLAKRMQVSRPRLGKALKKLEAKGFVGSDTLPNDKRSTQVSLTEKGVSTLAALSTDVEMAVHTFASDKMFASLPKATRVNSRLIAHLKAVASKPATRADGEAELG